MPRKQVLGSALVAEPTMRAGDALAIGQGLRT